MSYKKWYNIKDLGQFYIERELVYVDTPVFFTALCGKKRYLVEMLDDASGRYLLGELTETDSLVDMLEKKISMEAVFRRMDVLLETTFDENYYLAIKSKYSGKTIDADLLPDAGAMYLPKNDMVQRFIRKLKRNPSESEVIAIVDYEDPDIWQVDPVNLYVPFVTMDDLAGDTLSDIEPDMPNSIGNGLDLGRAA